MEPGASGLPSLAGTIEGPWPKYRLVLSSWLINGACSYVRQITHGGDNPCRLVAGASNRPGEARPVWSSGSAVPKGG